MRAFVNCYVFGLILILQVHKFWGRALVNTPAIGCFVKALAPAVDETIKEEVTSSNRDIDGRRRILIVDDEVDIVELIAAVLDEPDIHTAGSSDEALELLEQRQFDLILCDLMMPEKTGMDLHDEAIRRWPALAGRFAFVTGGAYTDEARRFLDQTQAPVLQKPFKLTRLRELVAGMLNRKPTTTE